MSDAGFAVGASTGADGPRVAAASSPHPLKSAATASTSTTSVAPPVTARVDATARTDRNGAAVRRYLFVQRSEFNQRTGGGSVARPAAASASSAWSISHGTIQAIA